MKKVLLVALLLGLCAYVGDAQTVIQATQIQSQTDATAGAVAGPGGKATGDLLYEIDFGTVTGDIRLLGCEFDDTDWWVTGAYDQTTCKLYKLDYAGNLLNTYLQLNSGWGWRDVAWDGSYLYCSDSFAIEQVDPATGAITGLTIASPTSPARALAYDSLRDLFWTGNFSDGMYSVDRAGNSVFYSAGLSGIYGAAYDPGSDKVWIWDQTYAGGTSGLTAVEFDPATGALTGNFWDGETGRLGIAGGACIFTDPTYGNVFAGMQQASPDVVSVYDLVLSTDPQVDIKANGGDAGVVVFEGSNVALTIKVEARGMAGTNADIWVLVKNDAGKRWSYNLAAARWFKGWCYEYISAPLADYTDTVLDMPLPAGNYDAYLGIDTNMNGNLNKDAILVYDHVDIEVKIPAAGFNEDFELGTSIFTPDPLDPAGWYVGAATTGSGVNSYYYQSGGTSYHYQGSLYKGGLYGDFVLSCDTAHITTASYSNIYYHGLCFRAQGDAADSYCFYVHSSGKIGIRARVGDSGGDLFYTYSPVGMNVGRDVKNNIEVVAIGSNMDLYINGFIVTTVVDSTWAMGEAGLYAEGTTSNQNLYEYDDVILN